MSELPRLLEWATSNGATVHSGVSFKETDDRGVAAIFDSSVPFNNDEDVLLKVPECLTLTPKMAQDYFPGVKLKQKSRNPLLMLLLAKLRFDAEETKTSQMNISQFFKPYLDILPDGKSTGSPLFWDGDERALILGTDLHNSLDSTIRKVVEVWYKTVSALPPSQRPSTFDEDLSFYALAKDVKFEQLASYLNSPKSWTSFPAFLWAHAILSARGFLYLLGHTEDAKDVEEVMLIPIFDLLNHDNNVQVKWEAEGTDSLTYLFKSQQKFESGEVEVFNNYGPKSNEELLMHYGFALPQNEQDFARLILRIPEDQVDNAKKFGVDLDGADVHFLINKSDVLPKNLVKLFCFLVKLSWENTTTLRNTLEGLDQLGKIVNQRLESLKKSLGTTPGHVPQSVLKSAKIYRTTQKQLYQLTSEAIGKMEKTLLKDHKPLSFKSIYKQDKTFANSLLLTFGIPTYEKLASSDDIDRAVLLWIIRCGNKKHYKDNKMLPDWIELRYQKKAKSITITKEDIQENMKIYTALFPALKEKIPEVFGIGEWGIKSFVLAESVIDEIAFTRRASNEVFFVEDVKVAI